MILKFFIVTIADEMKKFFNGKELINSYLY